MVLFHYADEVSQSDQAKLCLFSGRGVSRVYEFMKEELQEQLIQVETCKGYVS